MDSCLSSMPDTMSRGRPSQYFSALAGSRREKSGRAGAKSEKMGKEQGSSRLEVIHRLTVQPRLEKKTIIRSPVTFARK